MKHRIVIRRYLQTVRQTAITIVIVCIASATIALADDNAAAKEASPLSNADVTYLRAPKPLANNAVTEDWPWFLGPRHDGVSHEKPIVNKWSKDGPPVVWEMKTGEGYAAPSIQSDRLIHTYRRGGEIYIDCIHPENGKRWWRFSYPTQYKDRFGFNGGPRSSPVIADDHVYAYGPAGWLYCLKFQTGEPVWKKNLSESYKVRQDFFGVGTTPLYENGKLIINVGAPSGPCVVALDAKTGNEIWRAGDKWGPSYASPTPATFYGNRRVLVLAGGDSDPPVGGLLVIDPADGKIDFSYPFRSRKYESVIAASPIVFDNNIFITASYKTGAALIHVNPDMTYEIKWTSKYLGAHWATPIYDNGYIYGVDGESRNKSAVVCIDVKTGFRKWSNQLEWTQDMPTTASGMKALKMSAFRGSFIKADKAYICLGEMGHLIRLELTPEDCRLTHRAELFTAQESFVAPVLSKGLLYISQTKGNRSSGGAGKLICLDVRGSNG